ncbi:unnamed protein product [Effrenium voratum]|uniref:Uncharacterized protein n=1 Tax=Effrenium voratum TaxID=2562239 RepID=A0AA36JAV5_9DINO|nr:unnamed protein product [Effrenium voratum]
MAIGILIKDKNLPLCWEEALVQRLRRRELRFSVERSEECSRSRKRIKKDKERKRRKDSRKSKSHQKDYKRRADRSPSARPRSEARKKSREETPLEESGLPKEETELEKVKRERPRPAAAGGEMRRPAGAGGVGADPVRRPVDARRVDEDGGELDVKDMSVDALMSLKKVLITSGTAVYIPVKNIVVVSSWMIRELLDHVADQLAQVTIPEHHAEGMTPDLSSRDLTMLAHAYARLHSRRPGG